MARIQEVFQVIDCGPGKKIAEGTLDEISSSLPENRELAWLKWCPDNTWTEVADPRSVLQAS